MSRRPGSAAAAIGAAALRNRWFTRAPIWVFRAGLGFLFGSRLLMVQHIGRVSGKRRYVVLEVVGQHRVDTYLVVSGFGTKAQWFRNLEANPSAEVWVGGRRAVPAVAHRVTDDDADVALASYIGQHPAGWARLRPVVEQTLGRPINQGSDIPMMALELGGRRRP